MRKSKREAAKTRDRIIAAAAKEFRKNGIVATGLADLMAAAGLTHGGFYKHFESKDQLVAEACAESARPPSDVSPSDGADGLGVIAERYLSTAHRDDPSGGCFLSAIGCELARSDEKTRSVATDAILKFVDTVARTYSEVPPDVARKCALGAVSTMIGALTLARIVTDPELSQEILRAAKESVTKR